MKDESFHFPTFRQDQIWATMDTEGATQIDQWTYEDRDSQEAFIVLGFEREDRRKMLRTIWPVPDGYRTDKPPRPWPLYRLPELRREGTIYLCQSEALADRVRALGLLATTSAGGAGAVEKSDWSPLAGRAVVILPNQNEDGRAYARLATAKMTRQSPPAEVRVLALPGMGVNWTVGDFIDVRHPHDPRSIGEEIEDLADLTPEYWQLRLGRAGHKSLPSPALPTPLAKVAPLPETRWLWPGWIALGKLHLLLGASGVGHSLLGADLAARVSAGAKWPDASGPAKRGSVLLLAHPARVNDTIRPALAAAGADAARIITLPGLEATGWALVAALERVIEQEAGVRLLVIDPLSAYFPGNPCGALAALVKLASERRLAVLLIATLNGKTAGLTSLRNAGGHALAAASSAWLLVADRRAPETDRRLLLPVKSRAALCAGGMVQQALACRISGSTVAWEPGLVDVPIAELMSDGRARRLPGFPRVKRREAADWLRQCLARGLDGPLRREAEAAGWSWITVRRALADIGAVSERCPATGHFRWRLTQ